MKNINIILVGLTILLLASCGGNSKKELTPKTIDVKDVLITGEGKEYVKIVDGSYVLKPVEDNLSISIKFETIKKYEGEMNDYTSMGNLSFTPIDSLGGSIGDIGLPFSPASTGDWDKIKELLKSEPGTQLTVTFEWDYFSDTEKQSRILDEMHSFEISNTDITNPGGGTTNVNNTTNKSNNVSNDNTNTGSSNEDWDEILDDYEKFADDYIDYVKKISELQNKGDDAAMAEVAKLMPKAMDLNQQASDLGNKLSNASNDLTPSQMSRFTKIQTKFAKAALELSN